MLTVPPMLKGDTGADIILLFWVFRDGDTNLRGLCV